MSTSQIARYRHHRPGQARSHYFAMLLAGLVLGLFAAGPLSAVVLDSETRTEVVLEDGTTVTLYAEAGDRPGRRTRNYYFLPFDMRLSTKPDNTPEFLFTEFITEQSVDQGGLSGALMHFLVTWGPTPDKMAELESKLAAKQRGARLIGAVPLEVTADTGSFRIISATLSDGELSPSQVSSGRAPAFPGSRAAAAARLGPEGAQLMKSSFTDTSSIADLSLVFDYSYLLLNPAARGYIEVDWSKVHNQSESLEAEYKKWQSGKKVKTTKFLGITIAKSERPTYSRSYEEVRSEYDFLREHGVITVHFDQLRDGEATQKMQDAFFQFFLNMAAEISNDDEPPPPPSEEEEEATPNIRYGNKYTYKTSFTRNVNHRKTQRLKLSGRTAVRYPVQLVGNLMSWYDAVKDNPRCVSQVFLNDPFYDHRDINFIVDLDAQDIFAEQVNYVTINVRKDRNQGRAFEDRLTIDQEWLQQNGVNASLTYARGDDTSGDIFQYQVQWGLRGGKVWPSQAQWQRGDWESVSLAPPIRRRVIEVEADLFEMEENRITRATVQVRYPQFGAEEEVNIAVSPARGESLVEQPVFTDRDARGYVYRLVLWHRDHGQLVLPWQARTSDDYVFVNIPPELLADDDDENPVLARAREAAESAAERATDSVLDRFEEILAGGGS
ncbi:MAG: hypothetical protein WD397_13070 [Wenzhouxiangellaceae bacterium]